MKNKNKENKENKFLKYSTLGSRILLGLAFVIFGFGYFFMGKIQLDTGTAAGRFASALLATGYFFPFLKIVEGIAGLMLLFKRWTALALLILAPIIIQILLYDIFLDTSGLIIGIVCAVLAGFLAWTEWDKYKALFA